jgi:isoquinoline 1-oxidoreductase beta subunit
MTTPTGIDRRDFLQKLAASGIVIAISASGVRRLEAADALFNPSAANSFEPSVYLSIGDDNIITVICHRSEMGQGAKTGLTMAIADELEADWSNIRVEQAIGDPKYGSQNTDGSTSIRDGSYMKFRQAGAMARVMLEQAAAAEWGVAASEVAGRNGRVTQRRSARRPTESSSRARRRCRCQKTFHSRLKKTSASSARRCQVSICRRCSPARRSTRRTSRCRE